MTEVEKLEIELKKAKERESIDTYINLHKEICDFFQPLIGQTVGYFSKHKGVIQYLNVIRLNKIKSDNHYLEQGFYGQFSPKRFIEVKGTCLTIGSKFMKDSTVYSSYDGNVLLSEEYGGINIINSPPELSGTSINGLPIGIKKQWEKEFKRIVDCGTYSVDNCCFKFGDKTVLKDNCQETLTNFENFKTIYKLVPNELFDQVINLHVKQCKETYDLMSSFKNIELKNLNDNSKRT